MNRMGARSNSGEGGEDPFNYAPLPNGDRVDNRVKQVASGRFGVTAEYLIRAEELESRLCRVPSRVRVASCPATRCGVDRATPPRGGRHTADLSAAASRHLFDRGSGPNSSWTSRRSIHGPESG